MPLGYCCLLLLGSTLFIGRSCASHRIKNLAILSATCLARLRTMPRTEKELNVHEMRDLHAILQNLSTDTLNEPPRYYYVDKGYCIASIRGFLTLYRKGKGKGKGKSVADALACARAELQDVSADIRHRAMHVRVEFMRMCFLLICIVSTHVIIELTTLHRGLIQNRVKA